MYVAFAYLCMQLAVAISTVPLSTAMQHALQLLRQGGKGLEY